MFIQKIINKFDSLVLLENYINLLFRLIDQSCYEIRKQCCCNLVDLVQSNKLHNALTLNILKSFNQLVAHKCYIQRMAYIYICEQAKALFTRTRFNSYKLHQVLLLAQDKVHNVKRKLVQIMPQLRFMIQPDDIINLKKYQSALDFLAKDKDAAVQAEAKKIQ